MCKLAIAHVERALLPAVPLTRVTKAHVGTAALGCPAARPHRAAARVLRPPQILLVIPSDPR
jgi:hypothetical protein